MNLSFRRLITAFSLCINANAVWAYDINDARKEFNANKYDKSIPYFQEEAKRGNIQALGLLGKAYYLGKSLSRDIDLAYQLLEEAMKKGDSEAYNSMGHLLISEFKYKDPNRAIETLKVAVQKNHCYANTGLGKIYLNGAHLSNNNKVDIDFEEAIKWFKKAQNCGELESQQYLVEAQRRIASKATLQKASSDSIGEEEERLLAEQRLKEQQLAAQAAKKNAAEAVTYANRKALVIGNDSYQHVAKLLNAREDARAIAEGLKRMGYQVTLKTDLDQQALKIALRTFKNQIEGGDEVAIFYAGHGVQLANTNYLLPIDVVGESEDQLRDDAIPLQRILDDISDRKAKFTLAMIDACRDNPFKADGRSIGATRGLTPTTAATGQMIVFSAGTGQQAMDKLGPSDKDKNGVFTRVFLKQMEAQGLTIDRIFRNVRNEVVGLAKSAGHEQVPAIYDQVVGDFYFKK